MVSELNTPYTASAALLRSPSLRLPLRPRLAYPAANKVSALQWASSSSLKLLERLAER